MTLESTNGASTTWTKTIRVPRGERFGLNGVRVYALADTEGNRRDASDHPELYEIGTPGDVRGFTASVQANRDVHLTWTAPADNGGNALTGYRLRINGDAIAGVQEHDLPPGSTSYTANLGDYPAKSAVTFGLVAENAAGSSQQASRTTFAEIPATPPTAPRNLGVLPLDDRVIVKWDQPTRTGGYPVEYRVQAFKDGALEQQQTCTDTGCTMSGLDTLSTYSFEVVAEHSDARSTEDPSPAVASRAATLAPAVNVGTFNVQSVSLDKTRAARAPWRKRRTKIIRQIRREKLDVIGIQEANPASYWRKRLPDGINQFLDLRNGLRTATRRAGGSQKWAVTNPYGFNCKNPRTTFKCKKRNRKATHSERIIYDAAKLKVVKFGGKRFSKQFRKTSSPRYISWAIFEHRDSGRRFFFASVHLEKSLKRGIRRKQWEQLIDMMNYRSKWDPVVAVGDFNTQKMSKLGKRMLPRMRNQGFASVLDPDAGSMKPPTTSRWLGHIGMTGRVVYPKHTWINTANKNKRDVRKFSQWSKRWRYANPIDLIFADNTMTVKDYEVVVDYRANGKVRGRLPSDHNLVRATLLLPPE